MGTKENKKKNPSKQKEKKTHKFCMNEFMIVAFTVFLCIIVIC